MSERKVLNKYYPPDFDPSRVPRGKRNKNATFNIRIMAPFNMRCNMCKDYIYKGKKFNSRKEDVMDEDYLGLRIFRFYIKCPRCVSEIAFKTDLKNTDYTLEAGAIRLFEADKIAQQMAEQERKEKEEDELNPMKVLENRTKQSQIEMEQIDSLEEIREMNLKKNAVNTDDMIERYRKYEELLLQLQIEEEEKEIKEIFGAEGSGVVKRLHDSDSEEDEPLRKTQKSSTSVPSATVTTANATDILTNSEEIKVMKPKTQQVWEKSVGGLSSKHKLSGLVVKKKTAKLPPFSVSSSTGGEDNVTNTNTHSDKDVSTSSDSDISKTDANVNCIESPKLTQNYDSKEKDGEKQNVSVQKEESKTVKNIDSSAKEKSDTTSTAGDKPASLGGLGMLGAYSSDENDSSE